MSGDFVSQEHRVSHDGPKDSNAGGCTCEISLNPPKLLIFGELKEKALIYILTEAI
jgi:hypothetical protein